MSVKFCECAADFPRTIAMAFFCRRPAAQPPSLAAGFGTEVPLYGFHDDDFSTRLQAAALVGLMLTLDDLNLPGLIEIFMDFYGFVTDYIVWLTPQ